MALFDSIRSPCRCVSTLWQFAASRWYWWSASPCRLTAGVWTRCALDKLVGHNPEQAQSVAEMQTAKVTWTARRGIRKCIHKLYKNNKSTLIHIYCDSSDAIPHNPTQPNRYRLTKRALNFKSIREMAKPVMSPMNITSKPDMKSVVSPFQ